MTTREATIVAPAELRCPGVKHWYCCDENLSWCLMDISEYAEHDDGCGCTICAVCEDMETDACPNGCNAVQDGGQADG